MKTRVFLIALAVAVAGAASASAQYRGGTFELNGFGSVRWSGDGGVACGGCAAGWTAPATAGKATVAVAAEFSSWSRRSRRSTEMAAGWRAASRAVITFSSRTTRFERERERLPDGHVP